MHVERLRLNGFRNYGSEEAILAPNLNVLVGTNGQGKTNLLEAVYVAAGRNPPRFGGNSPLVGWGREEALVEAAVTSSAAQLVVALRINRSGRRLFVNGKRLRAVTRSPLVATLFCPETLGLVKEGAHARRELLDDLIERVRPAHRQLRADYARAVRQRNKALQHKGQAACELGIWDERLVSLGAELVVHRLEMVQRIEPLVSQAHATLCLADAGCLRAHYESRLLAEGVDKLETLFARQLQERRADELARGVTLVGPHRDDLALELDGHDVRGFGSQGEQRTAALALVLAEARLLAGATGEQPVLLLDDVLSELDPDRRKRLLAHVRENGQALVTTTSAGILGEAGPDANIIQVISGTVKNG